MSTLTDLITVPSVSEIKARTIELLAERDLPVTDWHEGGTERTLIEVDATVLADLYTLASTVAGGAYVDTSTGGWLTLLARGRFGLEREVATYAVHRLLLSDVVNGGPYTLTPGQLWFSTANGYRFVNVTGGTLTEGGTLYVEARAESPGSVYNAGIGTITNLVTSLPGVTVSNPEYSGTGTSMITQGTDEESDASLRQRCKDRWGEMGSGSIAGAYRNWAQAADPTVTRVSVSPSGDDDGVVNVYLAGTSGAVGIGVVDTVQAYIDERVPLTVTPVVASVTPFNFHSVGSISVETGRLAEAQAYITARLDDHVRTYPVGGRRMSGYLGGFITGFSGSTIVSLVNSAPGVTASQLSDSTVTYEMDPNEVLTVTTSWTWHEV